MKRIVAATLFAASLALGLGTFSAPVAAQNPTEDCQPCREAFTACMAEVRTPAEAAACRAAARACVTACRAE